MESRPRPPEDRPISGEPVLSAYQEETMVIDTHLDAVETGDDQRRGVRLVVSVDMMGLGAAALLSLIATVLFKARGSRHGASA